MMLTAANDTVARIKQPILDIVKQYIPVSSQGLKVMTIYDHGLSAFLAPAIPGVQFQPTTAAQELLESISAHCAGLPNVQPARFVSPGQEDWNVTDNMDAIIASHVVQSGPWAVTCGLMAGAGRHLNPGGRLFVYGPLLKDGQYMSEKDEAIDTSLRMRNPEWGYRDLADVVAAAEAHGLRQEAIHDMPGGCFVLVLRKAHSGND